MSLPSKSVSSNSVPSPINQSTDQAFGMPLFPGYVRPIPVPQPPAPAQQTANDVVTPPPTTGGRNTDVEKLLKQYGELSHRVQEQTRMYHKQSQTLQQQMVNQAAQHQSELRQLEQAWSHRLDTVIANTQKIADKPSAEHWQMKPPTVSATPRQAQPVNNRRYRESKYSSPLRKVPTTYRVPRRSQVRWVEKFLGAAPALVGLVVTGTIIAALSAIALSPTVLWPSLSLTIQAFIPFIFVIGLISVGITAVWDAAR